MVNVVVGSFATNDAPFFHNMEILSCQIVEFPFKWNVERNSDVWFLKRLMCLDVDVKL